MAASASSEQPIGLRPPAIASTASLPSHVLGLGGRFSNSAFGFAATARAWSRGRLGLQFEVGRSTLTSGLTAGTATSMQFAPSLVYAFPTLSPTPLVASLRRRRCERISLEPPNNTTTLSSSQTDLGFQSFGGGEVTFAAAPWIAISAEAGYNWADEPFPGFALGGPSFSLSAHWYVK